MSCNICLKAHEDENLIKTCDEKHIFCKTCFEDWKEECFKTSDITICPLCRSDLLEHSKNGLFIQYYENVGGRRQKMTEYNYVNGKREGLYQSWYRDGQKMCECNYVNGIMEGLYQKWYENGQKMCECNFVNGKEEGFFQYWYKNGNKKIKNDLLYHLDNIFI